MIFFDREFEGWRTTECDLFHCIFETEKAAKEKEEQIKKDKKEAIK